MRKCSLCDNMDEIKQSDIIPTFIQRWLKKTSSTGRFRDVITPNIPKQRIQTAPLLCNTCEQKFSKYEKYFSEKFFKPYLESYNPQFEYADQLQKFIISLAWRTVAIRKDDLSSILPNHHAAIHEAFNHWKNILLSNKIDNKYEHHMLFLRLVQYKPHQKTECEGINWYFLRSVDNTIAQSQNELFTFTLFPGFAFISAIKPKFFIKSKNTKIHAEGKIDMRKQIFDKFLFDFFKSRIRPMREAMASLSANQWQKIEEFYSKDLKSYGFAVFLADQQMHK